MSELVNFFGDAVELVWRGWKLVTPALALSAWIRIVAQAEEMCTCDRENCSRECDLSRSCSERGDSGPDTVH